MKVFGIVASVFLLCMIFFFSCTQSGIRVKNTYFKGLEKAHVNTTFESAKKVEDTARAMMATYYSDVQVYESYKNHKKEDMQEYGEQARMRAIRTANTYNEYINKNSFVWKENVPSDIKIKLETNI